MLSKLLKWLTSLSCTSLMGCKDPSAKNIQTDDNRQLLTMQCPPYGSLRFFVDDGGNLGEEWSTEKTECINWIQNNWQTLWPVVEEKLNEMATCYAYGETKLKPHLMNPKNSLSIRPSDLDHWTIALSIKREWGGHAFCIDLEREKVVEYQPVY
jgi:hypothetical protein